MRFAKRLASISAGRGHRALSGRGRFGQRISSATAPGLGSVRDILDPRVAYQTQLKMDGVMFAAGPIASDDPQ